jgi:UDP-3-O-[3-hydroxymyristoyl] glucosamine N-acyltransferase
VKLEKALILCQGNLTVGTDSIINGAVMVQKNAKVDSKSKITGDREVLEPFKSMVSY